MTSRTPLLVVSAVLFASLLPATSQAQQQQTYHKPMAPIGPTSDAQCRSLEADWSYVCKQISDAHQQCLDSYNGSNVKGAGECSRAPCLSLHTQMTTCGGEERSQMVSACYAQVRAHREREADFQRMQQAAIQAQQEAERQRRERFEAEAAKSSMEADAARQRAEAYRRAAMNARRNSRMDAGQRSAIDDLRDRAESAADRAKASLDRLHASYEALDFSAVREAGRELLINEGKAALMEGLSYSDRYAFIPETIDLYEGFADKVQTVVNGGSYVLDRIAGRTTFEQDWNAGLDLLEKGAEWAGSIPRFRFPGLHVANATGGIRDGFTVALDRLDQALQAFMEGRPFDPGNLEGDVMRAIMRRVTPWDTVERIDSGRSAIFNFFKQ